MAILGLSPQQKLPRWTTHPRRVIFRPMKAKLRFVILRGRSRWAKQRWRKQWFFRIVSPNNRTLAHSEGYNRKAGAINAVCAIIRGSRHCRTEIRK